ncbi:MAG: 30S ribosome-binding factor RbfA [Pirellulales bacterium]
MSSRRLLKAAEAIREVVSMAILTELRDPRVKNVTVTSVEVSPDMREAKVMVSVMGNENQQKLTLRGLENSAGFLQSKIAKRIDTRYTPRLQFVIDDGVKKSLAVAEILQKIAEERKQSEALEDTTQDDPEGDIESSDNHTENSADSQGDAP